MLLYFCIEIELKLFSSPFLDKGLYEGVLDTITKALRCDLGWHFGDQSVPYGMSAISQTSEIQLICPFLVQKHKNSSMLSFLSDVRNNKC